MSRPTWDETFLEICHVLAKRSKDQSTKIGSLIVGPDNEIISGGYNCFPRGTDDNRQERQERPKKYFYFEHAERNAIYNAARLGFLLKGTRIYSQWFPCADCARAIIQCGIKKIIVEIEEVKPSWEESCSISFQLFKEAGIEVAKPELSPNE